MIMMMISTHSELLSLLQYTIFQLHSEIFSDYFPLATEGSWDTEGLSSALLSPVRAGLTAQSPDHI